MLDPEELGRTIKEHRKSAGLSQLKLAELAGIGKTAVYDLEKGKETVKLSTLRRILRVLNIQVVLKSPLTSNRNPNS